MGSRKGGRRSSGAVDGFRSALRRCSSSTRIWCARANQMSIWCSIIQNHRQSASGENVRLYDRFGVLSQGHAGFSMEPVLRFGPPEVAEDSASEVETG